MKNQILFMAFVLAACGSSANSGLSAWATSDQNTFLSGCEATATQNGTAQQAATYCTCVLNVVMSRWSAADYSANASVDSTQLFNDGTVSACKAQAGA